MAPHQNSFSEFTGKLVVRGWQPHFSNPIFVQVRFNLLTKVPLRYTVLLSSGQNPGRGNSELIKMLNS